MAAALKEGLTVKQTAEKCNTAITTAFRWRHRFLKTMESTVAVKLEGIAEADETYFLESDQTSRSIKFALAGKLNGENILYIDGGNALWGFVCQEKIPCKVIGVGKHVHERDPIFHIQNVNAYHSRLKGWMAKFNGVATKYLPNYLGWRRMYEQGKAITPAAWMQVAAKTILQ